MNRITQLCIPLFRRISEVWAFKQRGVEIPERQILSELRAEFASIDERCEADAVLKKEFESIRLPLIFFIDYIFKEGGFSYSNQWRELARDYNELSGDEKFFDLLEVAENDASQANLIEPFYFMLGLGFDGIFKRDPLQVYRKMQDCMVRLPVPFDVSRDLITEQPQSRNAMGRPQDSFIRSVWFKVCLFAALAAVALTINFFSLSNATKDYSRSIDKALHEASPHVWMGDRGEEDIRRDETITRAKSTIESEIKTAGSVTQGDKR